MKQVLNNKAFTLCLSVAAVALVGWRLLPVVLPGVLETSAREAGSEEFTSEVETPREVRTNRVGSTLELVAWRSSALESEMQRDPFSFPNPPGGEGQASGILDGDPQAGLASLRLQAIATAGNQAYVVINGQILAAGEKVEGFEVLGIQRDQVIVGGMGARRILTLAFETPPPATIGEDVGAPTAAAGSEISKPDNEK